MKSQDRVRAGLLFDLYGPLLTDHQQEVWQLYYLEDWSLAEIGASRAISRAAVHDILERTGKLLEDYESRLGLLSSHQRRRERLSEALRLIEGIAEPTDVLKHVKAAIGQLAEEEGVSDV